MALVLCEARILARSWQLLQDLDGSRDTNFVCLTTYDGGAEDFMLTPLEDLVEKIVVGQLPIQIGPVFKLDQIAQAHRCMEENKAGGKIVVLT